MVEPVNVIVYVPDMPAMALHPSISAEKRTWVHLAPARTDVQLLGNMGLTRFLQLA
jgi:hypothetical protein